MFLLLRNIRLNSSYHTLVAFTMKNLKDNVPFFPAGAELRLLNKAIYDIIYHDIYTNFLGDHIMNTIFINFSNHPSSLWDTEQLNAARSLGEIVDIPFPNIPPESTPEDIHRICISCVEQILQYSPCAVLCQGEFTLTYAVVSLLKKYNIKVFAACSERQVVTVGNEKRSIFSFVQFREYL